MDCFFPDEASLLKFARDMAKDVSPGTIIFLQGELGAGKTSFSRGFLQGLGYTGKVKSPTYTLVEPYETPQGIVYHFDFYRLHHPAEVESLGIPDYFLPETICLIEWPEKAAGYLPAPDIICFIEILPTGRKITVQVHTKRGNIFRRES